MAALTIPSLISKNNEKETVVRLKKTYNTLSNAYMLAITNYGDLSQWGLASRGDNSGTYDPSGGIKAMEVFQNYLNITKNCQNDPGCWPDVTYKFINGQDDVNVNRTNWGSKVILADGTNMSLRIEDSECKKIYGPSEQLKMGCGVIDIDINGFKGPNCGGKDYFSFFVTSKGIIPRGTPEDITNGIIKCRSQGYQCTAWVLIKENMDYLTKDVNWDD